MNKRIAILIFSIISLSVNAQIATSWHNTGPDLFPTNSSGQVNGIGRVCQLKYHPSDPLKMYAVSASGGLWISTDGGLNWAQPGTDFLPQTACASICIDHDDDQTLYLGTGDPNYYYGTFGVWKSTDGGATWTQSTSGLGSRLPVQILMSPANTTDLVAATDDGIFKTTDAGTNWIEVHSSGDFTDMVFRPGSDSVLYAVTHSTVWRSVNFGDTWTELTNGVDIPNGNDGHGMRLAVSADNPDVVYVGMIKDEGTILRSDDGGDSFTTVYHNPSQSLVGYSPTESGQGNYNFGMAADPDDANTVFVVAHVVWRSTDGGINWTQLTDWYDQLHTDMHGISFNPYNNQQIFNVNDGGTWLSTDLGDNWIQSSDGLGATEIYHASQSPIRREMLSIGTQDNGELYHAEDGWFTNRGGDWGSRSAFDYHTDNLVYYFDSGNRRPVIGSEQSYNLPFNPDNDMRMAFNPLMDSLAFAAETNVYRTVNLPEADVEWQLIKNVNHQIKAIASSAADSSILYFITNNNQFYKSTDALAESPTFTNSSTPASANLFAGIAPVANDPDVVYITCGNKVFRSADQGSNFTNVTLNLPPVNIIGIYSDDFSTNESIFVCSAVGVYYKNSDMSEWQDITQNLPSVAAIRDFMFYNPGDLSSVLRVSYYGRGVWELPINTSYPPAPDFDANQTVICAEESVTFADASYGEPDSWLWEFEGGTPANSTDQNPTITYPSPGSYAVSLTVSNSNGTSDPHTETAYIQVVAPESTPIQEGFEETLTPQFWSLYDDFNNGVVWEYNQNVGGFGNSTSSAYFNNYNYDVTGQYDELRTAEYDFSETTQPYLAFDHAYAEYGGSYSDSLEVLISTDCGGSFTSIYFKGGQDLATAPDYTNGIFEPDATQWERDTLDLSAFEGAEKVMVAFRNVGHYGQAIYIDNVNFFSDSDVGLQEIAASAVQIYPNPVGDFLTVKADNHIEKIQILDASGRLIKEIHPSDAENRIDFQGWVQGIYFVQISDISGNVAIEKVVKF